MSVASKSGIIYLDRSLNLNIEKLIYHPCFQWLCRWNLETRTLCRLVYSYNTRALARTRIYTGAWIARWLERRTRDQRSQVRVPAGARGIKQVTQFSHKRFKHVPVVSACLRNINMYQSMCCLCTGRCIDTQIFDFCHCNTILDKLVIWWHVFWTNVKDFWMCGSSWGDPMRLKGR